MKKSAVIQILLIVFLSSSAFTINAQDKGKVAKIGIRAGWNYASMFIDNNELQGVDPNSSFYLGIFKEKKIVPLLRFGSGLEYVNNGYKISDDISREMHYLSVPLYLKVKVGPVYATGGTGLNFKVSENLPDDTDLDPLNNDKSNVFDMPLQLGVGLKILLVSIEARYNWGLIGVNNGAKNQYLQVGFTVSL